MPEAVASKTPPISLAVPAEQSETARLYECMLLFPAALADGERRQALESIESLVGEKNGVVLHTSEWGNRGLAYRIRGHAEGRYVVLVFSLRTEDCRELDAFMRLEKAVLRHLIVTVPDGYEVIDYDARLKEWLEERGRRKDEETKEREEETKKKIIRKAARKGIQEQKKEQGQKEAGEVVSLEEKLGKIISDEDLNL